VKTIIHSGQIARSRQGLVEELYPVKLARCLLLACHELSVALFVFFSDDLLHGVMYLFPFPWDAEPREEAI
jgi:hypothetical protein